MFEFSEYYEHLEKVETCNKSIKLVQAQKKHLSSSFGFVLNIVCYKESAIWSILIQE